MVDSVPYNESALRYEVVFGYRKFMHNIHNLHTDMGACTHIGTRTVLILIHTGYLSTVVTLVITENGFVYRNFM